MKVIFVSLDTLRATRLSCYGYGKPTSPHLDRIASEGVLFERAYAADIPTEVAHTDIFTGKLGLRTGIVSHGSTLTHLAKTTEWLPTMMRNAGYTTAAVDNLYQLKEWFARGFNYYINSVGKKRWIDGRTVNDLAKAWIGQHKDDDFFLFLHYWDAHTPYLPPEQYKTQFYEQGRDPFDPQNRSMEPAYNHTAYPFFKHHHYDLLGNITDSDYMSALYDAEIRYLDDMLLELDEFLEAQGIKEDTLLVLFGDHGESLDEHDIYWDHCGLYEATVRVPIIMRWPGHIPAGRRVSGLVQQVDMMPTILEAAGLKAPASMDGRSLWPSIRGEAEGTQSHVFLSECAWQASRGVVTAEHKFIRTVDAGPFSRPPRELYDLRHDPNESVNLAEERPELADQYEAMLDDWIASMLDGRADPMTEQLQKAGLPFRQRIEAILNGVGLTWQQWQQNPDRALFDEMHERARKA